MTETDFYTEAFNRGSDDRVKGKSLSDNPYLPGTPQGRTWRRGWCDVDRWWGSNATHRTRALPSVYGFASRN